ncbi:phosphatidylglycerophosphatase A family protein [Ferrovibrio xuzhouensis]|uniref:Phosphatidylglycerophosphatase A n=1 Tax=Ferrovibrio xuzhouensis TaxID=1576914 RepID=A0ABV7VLU3_9PROT
MPALPFLLCTWFGLGKLPKGPGTWGSLGALPFAWALQMAGGPEAVLAATVAISLVSLWAIAEYLKHQPGEDPGEIVIDEVAGQWLTLAFVPLDWRLYVIGFVAFRIFDIFKPWPVSWADRQIGGARGVLLDDLLAGVYAALVMFILLHFW